MLKTMNEKIGSDVPSADVERNLSIDIAQV